MDWVDWSMVDRGKGVMPRFNLRRALWIGRLASSTRDGARGGHAGGRRRVAETAAARRSLAGARSKMSFRPPNATRFDAMRRGG
jgi:hypothetical protein